MGGPVVVVEDTRAPGSSVKKRHSWAAPKLIMKKSE